LGFSGASGISYLTALATEEVYRSDFGVDIGQFPFSFRPRVGGVLGSLVWVGLEHGSC
jgi:hypothetical protein